MGLLDISKLKRGQTAFGPVATTSATDLADWPGSEKWSTDENPSTGVRRSNRAVLIRLVRNSAGVSLKGKRLAVFKAGTLGCEVDGYTRLTGAGNYIALDEYLPSAGVRANDICWGVVRGPAMLTTNDVGDATNVFSQGSNVIAATAASSQDDTAGKVAVQSFNASTQVDQSTNLNQAVNAVGRAMTAKTTGNTNADLLVDIDYHR